MDRLSFYTKNLIRLLAGILLVAGLSSQAAQAGEESLHQVASLQLLHPVATSRNPETSTHFRVGLLYARSGKIRGADFTVIAGKTSGTMRGLQYTGAYSEVGGEFIGFGLTGGVHNLRDDGTGLQISGLANYVEGMFSGFQYAGFLNYTHGGMFGAQFSGLMNINDGYGGFCQVSGVANVNVEGFSGIQVAFFINHANSEIAGGQLGMLNFAEDMYGAQIGVINLSRQFEGLQVGILNFNRHFEGMPIGLVNFATGSRREWVFSGGTTTAGMVGFRTVVNNWSSIVSAGWGDLQGDVEDNYLLGWHFGRCFPLNDKWSLTADLGFQHIIRTTSDNDQDNVSPHYTLQARLTGEYRASSNIGIFAGAGMSTAFSEYSSHAMSTTDPLLMGGISIGLDQ